MSRVYDNAGVFRYIGLSAPAVSEWQIRKNVDLGSNNSLTALVALMNGAINPYWPNDKIEFKAVIPASTQAQNTWIDPSIDSMLQRDRAGNPQILIPTPTFVPKVAQGVPNAGQALQWDGTQYKLGKDVYTGPIDWDIPKPTIKDKTVVVPLPNADGIITNTKINDYTWDGTGVSVINNDIEIDEKRVGHIFRDSDGHFTEDTAENREELLNTANEDNYLGEDQYGNDWYAKNRDDGSQIWVQARNNKIINGGLNPTPRPYNDMSGLSKPTKPPQKILNIAGEEVMSLSELEAFNAMVDFLEEYYKRTKADEIGGLLSSLIILDDGITADPAAWKDWIQSVSRIKENN
ncbi:hypothetical protein MNQ98_09320 [Paenibacillus sp. N3/727]|uniref:hypothetical protein n=1 Tax=Paenibacillus sp. N3/727 TaxID=2925845 RepID=UPI001F53DA5B|nr:hypothetical protein [Paenibacillus sp. N3/727]UNK20187.1 hypothetical protein MNQ98_09320 [Paenibacillus sp. N3/727]